MAGYFFPDGDRAVLEAARGLALAHPDVLAVCPDPLFVRAVAPAPGRRVALVSGGGAGHEPLHAGFVGPGGLDAACPGEIFTSPHNRAVYEASRAVALPGGVLHVVKNYTGDVINFAIAAERLRADGVDVATVLVDDDLATDAAADGGGPGRRGTGATVLVEKVLGAAADAGASLAELADLGTRVAAAARSVAVASRAQTSPATGAPAFELAGGELEYGVGIHGERAATTLPPTAAADVVARMVEELTAAVRVGEAGAALLVNGLGAVTGLELHAVRAAAGDALAERGVRVATSAVGTYTAALDMRGFSLTLLALEPGWLELLRAPTGTPALPVLAAPAPEAGVLLDAVPAARAGDAQGTTSEVGAEVLARFTAAVAQVHGELTALDQRAGDGDFGDNLAGGLARAARSGGSSADLASAAAVFLDEVGGSSGPLLGLLLAGLARGVEAGPGGTGLGAALDDALTAIGRAGGAREGDRTLVDALAPAARAARAGSGPDGLDPGAAAVAAATAAVEGARATSALRGRRGRSSYVGDRALGAPDPGAVAVALLLVVLAQVVAGSDHPGVAALPSPGDLAAVPVGA